MGEDVPVRWFNFEKVVEALVQQKIFYLKVSQLYNIVRKKCYIEDEAEMSYSVTKELQNSFLALQAKLCGATFFEKA